MIRKIDLRGSDKKLVQHFDLLPATDRELSVVLRGFIPSVSFKMDETAIARMHSDNFDMLVESTVYRDISGVVSESVARLESPTMKVQKKVSVENKSVSTSDFSISAQKRIKADLESVIAHIDVGGISLNRLRTMADDANKMMSDDANLTLTELYRYEEMG